MTRQELTEKPFPSNHLATNAVCRAYDNGVITFDEWVSSELIQTTAGQWFVTFP